MKKTYLYRLCQCTWGFLQTILGFIFFLIHCKDKHYSYHGAVVTEWENTFSISLGLFVFIAANPYRKLQHHYSSKELLSRLLVHEYGHTIQSLLLGPFYLLFIGIPSASWANLPSFRRKRRAEQISYFSFYTEKWANHWGEKVLGEKSMENLLID